MSPAQMELFRLGYGLQLGQPTGAGFEIAIAQFLEVLLLASKGFAFGHFLSKLGHKPARNRGRVDPLLSFAGSLQSKKRRGRKKKKKKCRC